MREANFKYRQVMATLKAEIRGGKYPPRSRFPSVAMVVRRFGVSSLTAVKAVNQLKAEGLVRSFQGKGTFVSCREGAQKVGLIMPGVADPEFVSPLIVCAVANLAQSRNVELVFGDTEASTPERQFRKANELVGKMVAAGVSGVIYHPLRFLKDFAKANARVVSAFDAAGIPVVLMGWDVVLPPDRSRYDVVGIDNYAAGRLLTRHLIERGARNISLLLRPDSVVSAGHRAEGVAAAVRKSGVAGCRCSVHVAEPDDLAAVRRIWRQSRPDAFICGNDAVVARFKRTLARLGVRIPDDVMLAAFDDVQLAVLQSPSVTSLHQPCAEIGEAAFEQLMDRMAGPDRPPREILLAAPLVVRDSTARRLRKK